MIAHLFFLAKEPLLTGRTIIRPGVYYVVLTRRHALIKRSLVVLRQGLPWEVFKAKSRPATMFLGPTFSPLMMIAFIITLGEIR